RTVWNRSRLGRVKGVSGGPWQEGVRAEDGHLELLAAAVGGARLPRRRAHAAMRIEQVGGPGTRLPFDPARRNGVARDHPSDQTLLLVIADVACGARVEERLGPFRGKPGRLIGRWALEGEKAGLFGELRLLCTSPDGGDVESEAAKQQRCAGGNGTGANGAR